MSGFVTEIAPRSAEVDACIQCGLCLPFCPTYRLTGDERYSPRGRLAAMSAVIADVTDVGPSFEDALSTCLGCRACEAVCPGLVPYGRAYEGAKAELAAQRPSPSRRVRAGLIGRLLEHRGAVAAATGALSLAQRLGLASVLPAQLARSLRGMRGLSSEPPSWVGREVEAIGEPRGTAALLAGCVMDAWFGSVHAATIGVLTRAGYRVVVPENQTCCGALAAHDGLVDDARRMAATNADAFADADLIVADAAGCSAHLSEYGEWTPRGEDLQERAIDATILTASLLDAGLLPMVSGDGTRVAIQDPCHLRHAQRDVTSARTVVRAAGLTPIDIDQDGLCCGAAGVYSMLHPETSGQLGRRKKDQIEATGAQLVASANPGCEMQLRAHLSSESRVAHPVELYWEALVRAGPALASAAAGHSEVR